MLFIKNDFSLRIYYEIVMCHTCYSSILVSACSYEIKSGQICFCFGHLKAKVL